MTTDNQKYCHHCFKRLARPGYSECIFCRTNRINRYKREKARGICTRCHVAKIDTSRSQANCSKCLDKYKSATKENIETRRSNGICLNCGTRPQEQGITICSECKRSRRDTRTVRKNKGLCTRCETPTDGTSLCLDCLGKEADKRILLKIDALNACGGQICKCCGETTWEFLTIDHINNNGAEHRKSHKGSIYWWLKTRQYPPGFQVLCFNCNIAKGLYGICPHQLRR